MNVNKWGPHMGFLHTISFNPEIPTNFDKTRYKKFFIGR